MGGSTVRSTRLYRRMEAYVLLLLLPPLCCCCCCCCCWLVPNSSSRSFFVVPVEMNRARCSLLTHTHEFSISSTQSTRQIHEPAASDHPCIFPPPPGTKMRPNIRPGGRGRSTESWRKRPSGLHVSIMRRTVRLELRARELSLSR